MTYSDPIVTYRSYSHPKMTLIILKMPNVTYSAQKVIYGDQCIFSEKRLFFTQRLAMTSDAVKDLFFGVIFLHYFMKEKCIAFHSTKFQTKFSTFTNPFLTFSCQN